MKIEDEHRMLLPVSIETTDSLDESGGVPRKVVVYHGVAKILEIDTFSAGFGRDEEATELFEMSNGLLSLVDVHRAVNE